MLLTRGANSYTNDLNGNTLTGGGRTNTWDGENRLTQCVTGTDTRTFVYGADGMRRQSTANSVVTDFVLDNQFMVRERNGSANVATYLIGLRGPEYRRNDSTGVVRWYLFDGLGSVLGEVGENGNVTASRKYDVFGGVRASTGTSTTVHKFVGSQGHPSEDGSTLIYMQARWLDPMTGRFTSEDPARSGSNWFNYAGCDPVNCIDPDGKVTRYAARVAAAVYVYLAMIGVTPAHYLAAIETALAVCAEARTIAALLMSNARELMNRPDADPMSLLNKEFLVAASMIVATSALAQATIGTIVFLHLLAIEGTLAGFGLLE